MWAITYVIGRVYGVTQLDDILYVLCHGVSNPIRTYTADKLTPLGKVIDVEGLTPCDIVACRRNRQLYVADEWNTVSLMSADDHSYEKWVQTTESETYDAKLKLSLTRHALLVTSMEPPILRQYIQRRRQAANAWDTTATVHASATRRWNVAWYICRRSPRHIGGQATVRGEWTVSCRRLLAEYTANNTALHGIQAGLSLERNVCPSVCQRKKVLPRFLYHMKERLSSFFHTKNGWWGTTSCIWNFGSNWPVQANRRFSIDSRS